MKRGKAARAAWALTVCALIVAAALADSSPAADHEPAAEPVPEIQCDLCHETDAEFSHPVGVTPSMEVPAHLPLEEGRINCTTCHSDPGAALHLADPGRRGSMLRASKTAEGFCAQCHRGAARDRSRMHGSFLKRAHLLWPRDETPRVAAIDQTRTCQSCHDGVLASDAGPDLDDRRSHSVGERYGERRRTRRARFRPAASLPREIRLFDGRVGCGSCHNPFSPRKALLAMDNEGSRLCLSCHDM